MPATLKYEAEGVQETIRAFSGIGKDLRPEANAELRVAAREAAGELASRLRVAAGSSPTPAARLLVGSIKVKSDRSPTVTIGGKGPIPRSSSEPGGRLGAIQWGTERGGSNFGAAAGGAYWIKPTVDGYASSGAVAIYRRKLYELARRYGVAA